MDTSPAPNPYRMLKLVVRHGAATVNGLAALAVLGGLAAAALSGPWWLAPLGAAGAVAVYVLGHSFVELVHVIVDMLVPK